MSVKRNDVVVMKALTNNIKRHGIGVEKRKDRIDIFGIISKLKPFGSLGEWSKGI